jgi:hypothetical protein
LALQYYKTFFSLPRLGSKPNIFWLFSYTCSHFIADLQQLHNTIKLSNLLFYNSILYPGVFVNARQYPHSLIFEGKAWSQRQERSALKVVCSFYSSSSILWTLSRIFHPFLTFMGKEGAYRSGVPSVGLLANIRPNRKVLPWTNH